MKKISEIIIKKEYVDIIENPSRENQQCFVIDIKNFIWLVPFIIDEHSNLVLKTAFPSRKFNKIFGGKNEK